MTEADILVKILFICGDFQVRGIDLFHDKAIELEQYRQETETPIRDVKNQADCAEVFLQMAEIARDDPEVVDFYAGVIRNYRKKNPASLAEQRKVVSAKLDLSIDLGLLSPKKAEAYREGVNDGSAIYSEAKTFFSLFRSVIPKDKIPNDKYVKKPKKPIAENKNQLTIRSTQDGQFYLPQLHRPYRLPPKRDKTPTTEATQPSRNSTGKQLRPLPFPEQPHTIKYNKAGQGYIVGLNPYTKPVKEQARELPPQPQPERARQMRGQLKLRLRFPKAVLPVELTHEEVTPEAVKKPIGWKYDELVSAYSKHPLNRLAVRYKRDFAGFDGKMPEPVNMNGIGTASDNGTEWFVAYMRSFPLLDGLAHEVRLRTLIERGLQAHLKLQSHPEDVISSTEHADLLHTAIIGAGAYQTMFECNLRLVKSVAQRKTQTNARSQSDIIQDACIGLRRAIQKYDPERGIKFSTYAMWWIRQAIQRKDLETGYSVRLPSHALKKMREIHSMQEGLRQDGLPPLSQADLKELGYTEEEIYASRHFLARHSQSLDAPLNSESDASRYDLLPGGEDGLDSTLDTRDAHRALNDYLVNLNLTDVEKIIFSLRNGVVITGFDYTRVAVSTSQGDTTYAQLLAKARLAEMGNRLEDIGALVGRTRERVRQIDVLIKLRLEREFAVKQLAARLSMSDDEEMRLRNYLDRRGIAQASRRAKSMHTESEDSITNSVVTLLSYLDDSHADTMRRTMALVKERYNSNDDLCRRIMVWLTARFDPEFDGSRPFKETSAKKFYNVDALTAQQADTLYIGVLAGTISNLPNEFRLTA